MQIAIFGKNCKEEDLCYIEDLFSQISLYSKELFVSQDFFKSLQGKIKTPNNCNISAFEENKIKDKKIDILFSLGGDGTLLDTLSVVKNTTLPVLGINLGHLGFLTSVGRKEIKNLLSEIEKGNYKVEKHSVLKASCKFSKEERFAINEVCVRSLSPGELLEIDAYIGDEYLTTYTSDGLIATTPTGSTAYSMSCGGPIISPNSRCLCITPISPHNLTLRPLIIPDDSLIRFVINDSRKGISLHLDSQIYPLETPISIEISKADMELNVIRMQNQTFFSAIRNKLMWGTNLRQRKSNDE